MLTRDDIKGKLEEDFVWQPPMDASDTEWDLYEEVRREIAAKKGLSEDDSEDPGIDLNIEDPEDEEF